MTLVAIAPPTSIQRRLEAFCSPKGGEVFRSVVGYQEIWRPDPFDEDTIHAEARLAFQRLLSRAAQQPSTGSILLLLGVSGSGKTHLMRAFRNYVHANGRGYCGYLQMTSTATNYARYILNNLIDALDLAYQPPEIETSSLMRLSLGLLECVPGLTVEDRTQFRDGYLTNDDLAQRVHQYADCVVTDVRFQRIDIDLIRALLYLQRDDARIRGRVLKFLRCEELSKFDRELLGDIAAKSADEYPLRLIAQLGQLMHAIQEVPLVLCIDQLEDTGVDTNAQEKPFRRVVGTLIAITSMLPTAVVVIACLEDYYVNQKQSLSMPQIDRIELDPEPIRLTTQRTLDEIEALIARRLDYLYDEQGVPIDQETPTHPFTRTHLSPLTNMRTRDVLNYCRLHRERCLLAGQWVEPNGIKLPPQLPPLAVDLDQQWNDFVSHCKATVPDEEDELATKLAEAITHASDEIASGEWFAAERDGHVIPIEQHGSNNTVNCFLAAVCNRGTQGGGLGRQLGEVEKRAGEVPMVLVRSTEFPTNPKAEVTKRIAQLISKRHWRRVVVENADWRRMLAMQEFRKQHGERADFKAWLQHSRPLTQLASLQQILRLDPLLAVAEPPSPSVPPSPSPAARASQTQSETGALVLGVKRGVGGEAVTLETNRLVQHVAFLGGTGSGKTTAALNLIEQVLLRGIPAVLLDRKGDLCRYADPAAWTTPLASPELAVRRAALRQRLDIALFTPGQPQGRPLSIPLVPEGQEQLSTFDRELLAGYAAASLGGMMNYRSTGPDQKKLAVLRKAVELLGELAGKDASLPTLIQYLADDDASLYAAVGNLADTKLFRKLAEDLQTLQLNQKRLLAGDAEQLNFDALLGLYDFAQPGKTRLSIISTRFLTETTAVEFWVSQFLTALNRWCARRPRGELQAVFLFDEADLYLPATRQPATKAPMENLLKRGRSAGISVFLATQSPGDFDYKCRDNIQTWLAGRIKEETALKKLKPMFSDCRLDVAAKLPSQELGQFYLLREREATALSGALSLLKTEQVPEERILELSRLNRLQTAAV